MIKIYRNIITDDECNELISFFESNKEFIKPVLDDNVYHYNGIDISDKRQNFSFSKRFLKIEACGLRIQHVDNKINVVEEPHGHFLPYSFIIFLNDDFEGGELIFSNITVKPLKGQLLYFTGDEIHNVAPVISGDRYTLVAFLFDDINIKTPKLI